MKKNFKNYLKIILVSCLLIITSCERNLYEESTIDKISNIKLSNISLSTLDSKTATKINSKISSLKKELKEKKNSKFQYNSNYGFYIDSENGKLIEKDGKQFYTFPMFRENEEKLENILFTFKSNGDLDAYFVKYDIKPEDFLNLSISQAQNVKAEYGRFEVGPLCVEVITTTLVYPNCPHPGGVHENGAVCQPEVAITSVMFCSQDAPTGTFNSTDGGGNTTGGNTTGPTGTSSPSGGGGHFDSGDVIITIPIAMTEEQIKIKDFIDGLDDAQQEWFSGENFETTEHIIKYLILNDFSSESQDFIKDLIDAINNNIDVDVLKNIIYGINKPCQKQIVKNIIDTCSPFTELIYQTFNTSPTAGITFSNGTNPFGNPASTNPIYVGTPQNFTIKIRFDDVYLDTATNLSIVSVTLHELVHAYLMNLYLTNHLVATNSDYNTLLNAFIAFYNNQVQDTFDPLDNEIHNAMKDFIQKMANSIYNYAQTNNIPNVTPDYCVALAWSSMYGTDLFQTTLTNQQQIDYGNIGAIEQDNLPGAKGTKCN